MALAFKLPYTYEDYRHWDGDWKLIEGEAVGVYMMVDYELKKVKLYRLINFKYQKIDEKDGGVMGIEVDGCKIEFNIDDWLEVV